MARVTRTKYPAHLARLVLVKLREAGISPPPERVVDRFLEILFFASLKTDELRFCKTNVNFMEPPEAPSNSASNGEEFLPAPIRFRQRIPLTIRTLSKLAEAVDPTVSAILVCSDTDGDLFIWGMLDQEARHRQFLGGGARNTSPTTGLFQVSITGVGSLSVFRGDAMLGSLEQNSLIAAYHDVLWEGPVFRRLKANLRSSLINDPSIRRQAGAATIRRITDELVVRWQNALCQLLLNIRHYGHGGGLLIVQRTPVEKVNIKYQIRYDRLPRSLFGVARHQFLNGANGNSTKVEQLPGYLEFVNGKDQLRFQQELIDRKENALSCVRFIASLSRVDGFVLLDKSLVVHGFGVETRSDCDNVDIFAAADAPATSRQLRQISLNQFGTRHRAMIRYCHENEDSLGFVVSQDGDIRAVMKVRDRLIVWENINVQVGMRQESESIATDAVAPMSGLFHAWNQSLLAIR